MDRLTVPLLANTESCSPLSTPWKIREKLVTECEKVRIILSDADVMYQDEDPPEYRVPEQVLDAVPKYTVEPTRSALTVMPELLLV